MLQNNVQNFQQLMNKACNRNYRILRTEKGERNCWILITDEGIQYKKSWVIAQPIKI